MRVAVVKFPASNCDLDVLHVLRDVLGAEAELVWHRRSTLKGYDAVILPGGFSYGDYLRAGVIAAKSPIMGYVRALSEAGAPVLGICNGFQVLVEAGLLPGALIRNDSLKFVCRWVTVSICSTATPFTRGCEEGCLIKMPVAHNEGRYFIDEEGLRELHRNRRIVFKYVDGKGTETPEANPNGSLENIAGVCSPERNVVGLMPHPERASEAILDPSGEAGGLKLFEAMLEGLRGR